MRKYFILLTGGLFVILFTTTCIKDLEEDPNSNTQIDNPSMSELTVPANFTWENSKSIDLSVFLEATKAYQPKSKISVYNETPEMGGELVASGSADPQSPFEVRLTIPANSKKIYLTKEGPFGGITGIDLEITGSAMEYTFDDSAFSKGTDNQFYKSILNGPDCESGCDEYISGSGNVNISGGKTYCIDESFTGKITFQAWNGGGTIKICGVASFSNNTIGMYTNCNIIVAEGGSLTTNTIEMGNNSTITIYNDAEVEIDKMNSWSEMASLINYGNVTINKNSYYKGHLENYGNLTFNNNIDIDQSPVLNSGNMSIGNNLEMYGSQIEFTNNGIVDIVNNLDISNNSTVTNNGQISTGGKFELNTQINFANNGEILVGSTTEFNDGSIFTNSCKFISDDDISLNGSSSLILETGFLKTLSKLYIWTSGTVSMSNGSMISCDYTEISRNISGTGELNSIVVNGDVKIWNNNKIDGAIEMAIESGELAYGGAANFINGATYTSFDNASNYLPVTACNPDGLGNPTIVDTDNDGVPDEIDDFPEDPLRAFNNYFPDESNHATIAFEDLWPATGDYDFNDMVVAVSGNEVTNADNKVVDIYLNFAVKAAGASFQNGFGFQMENITPEMISEVSGMVLERGYVSLQSNGVEANQSKAVIIVTENVEDVINRNGESMFNTIPDNPLGTSDTTNIVIHFANPVDRELVSNETYNPFLIKEQQRSFEIHLPYYPPTSLMNTALFGTGQDASNPEQGIYYVTKGNLPWGLMILEPFDYPVEKAEITETYNFFSTWAESGGTIYNDWYDASAGYRNNANIFTP